MQTNRLTARQIKDRLLENSQLLAETLKRDEKQVEQVVYLLQGDKQQMLKDFLVGLNLPLNAPNLILLNSVLKEQEISLWDEFIDWIQN